MWSIVKIFTIHRLSHFVVIYILYNSKSSLDFPREKDDVIKKKSIEFKERGNKYSKWMRREVDEEEDAIKKKKKEAHGMVRE